MKLPIQLLLVSAFTLMVTVFFWTWTTQEKHFPFLSDTKELVCSANTNRKDNVNIENSTKPKLILFLKFREYYLLDGVVGFSQFESCKKRCELATNVSRINEADVVIVYSHYVLTNSEFSIAPTKKPGQIWIFFAIESPVYSANSGFGRTEWHGVFNWTMSYRFDSELWYGYVKTARRNTPVEAEKRAEDEHKWRNVFSKKTKMVAWIVSHCETDSQREKYVSELSKHIQVDIYGTCGNLKCADEKACMDMLRNDYFFYLSFENSLCTDYVTEKLKKVYDLGVVVPVVRGGADYQSLFPDNSFVDVKDFSSAENLAKHLKELAANEDAYVKLLQWSWNYFLIGPVFPMCQLCERLYEPQLVSCYYRDVYKWWSHDMCNSPRDV